MGATTNSAVGRCRCRRRQEGGVAGPNSIVRVLLVRGLLAAAAAIVLSPAHLAKADALWGVYDFAQSWSPDISNVQAFSSKSPVKPAVVHFFPDWCGAVNNNYGSTFGSDGFLGRIWNQLHAVPLISWQPFCYDSTGRISPDNFTALVANGNYDAYIKSWAQNLQSFLNGDDGKAGTADDRRAYLRLAHEMNLYATYPWGLDPVAYVKFWQHVRAVFDGYGLLPTQLQWMWCPNNFGQADSAPYYPGDKYVDWTCFDAYNNDGYAPAAGLVDPVIKNLTALAPSKPLAVAEFGDVSAGDRPSFISSFLAYMADSGRAKLVAYFNSGTFAASGDAGFANAIQGHALLGPDSSNPRIITDEQFLGTAASSKNSSTVATKSGGFGERSGFFEASFWFLSSALGLLLSGSF
ncbi:glycoside hydrolase superfamily [Zopfochytrium polystomum]|nr:glycoside hydrolase superfamily [Zopfochytrium polystomum]